jgi:hypothetical protein
MFDSCVSNADPPCSQSQIGQDRYLPRQGTAQVHGTLALSVVVRCGPVQTAVNGTLVARPVTLTWQTVVPLAPSLTAGRVGPR